MCLVIMRPDVAVASRGPSSLSQGGHLLMYDGVEQGLNSPADQGPPHWEGITMSAEAKVGVLQRKHAYA